MLNLTIITGNISWKSSLFISALLTTGYPYSVGLALPTGTIPISCRSR